MKPFLTCSRPLLPLFLLCLSFGACINSKKIDDFVSKEYNNEIPSVKKRPEIPVSSGVTSPTANISVTDYKVEKFLPLLFYWEAKDRFTTKLNPQIGVNNFMNALNGSAGRPLVQKLNGQKLELTVEQLPAQFALAAHSHTIWVVYYFSWYKVWIQPDANDLVVNYTFYPTDGNAKTGKITVKNTTDNKNLRFFQSWRSAISEYIVDYNNTFAAMTKSFASQLATEL